MEAKVWYFNKIAVINKQYPLVDGLLGGNMIDTLPMDACYLVSYLVLQTRFITSK